MISISLTNVRNLDSNFLYTNFKGEEEKNIAKIFKEQIEHLRASPIAADSISLSQKIIDQVSLFLSKYKGDKSAPAYIKTLERVALSFCSKFPWASESNKANKESLKTALAKHDANHLQKWTKSLAQPEDLFFQNPEFADFMFSGFLHKSMLYFKHSLTGADGQIGLAVNGQFTAASEILNRFFVENGVVYSIENGMKKRWMYNHQGLVCFDPSSWLHPIPFNKLSTPPGEYRVQVVTSLKDPKDHNLLDKVSKGAVHSWLRLVTPEGDVYSLGWGHNPKEFNLFQPLASLRARLSCPDTFEVTSSNFLETTIPISEQQAESLLEFVAINAYDDSARFNYFSGNCVEFASQALEYANIAQIPDRKISIPEMLYKVLVPKPLKKGISFIVKNVNRVLPGFIKTSISGLFKFCFSLVLMPLVIFLGAWKRNSSARQPIANLLSQGQNAPHIDPNAPEIIRRVFGRKIQQLQGPVDSRNASSFRRGLFRSILDIFNPQSYEISIHAKLKKWQAAQGSRTALVSLSAR